LQEITQPTNQPTNQPTSELPLEKVVVIIMLTKARELTLLWAGWSHTQHLSIISLETF